MMKLLESSLVSPSRWIKASAGSTLALGGRPMPLAEENTWWLVSTAMMSLYLVIDQNAP